MFLVTVVFGFELVFCAALLSEAQRLIGLQVACHFFIVIGAGLTSAVFKLCSHSGNEK